MKQFIVTMNDPRFKIKVRVEAINEDEAIRKVTNNNCYNESDIIKIREAAYLKKIK